MQTLIKPASRTAHTLAYRPVVVPQPVCKQSVPQPKPVATAIVIATPVLDRHTYERLIVDATELYAQGNRTIHIDLQQTQHIEQSGLFALYCVHLIFQGERLPDPEAGMAALRYVTERAQLDGEQPVYLINVPEHLTPLIARAGFMVSDLSDSATTMLS